MQPDIDITSKLEELRKEVEPILDELDVLLSAWGYHITFVARYGGDNPDIKDLVFVDDFHDEVIRLIEKDKKDTIG